MRRLMIFCIAIITLFCSINVQSGNVGEDANNIVDRQVFNGRYVTSSPLPKKSDDQQNMGKRNGSCDDCSTNPPPADDGSRDTSGSGSGSLSVFFKKSSSELELSACVQAWQTSPRNNVKRSESDDCLGFLSSKLSKFGAFGDSALGSGSAASLCSTNLPPEDEESMSRMHSDSCMDDNKLRSPSSYKRPVEPSDAQPLDFSVRKKVASSLCFVLRRTSSNNLSDCGTDAPPEEDCSLRESSTDFGSNNESVKDFQYSKIRTSSARLPESEGCKHLVTTDHDKRKS